HVQIAAAALPPSPAPEHALGEQAAHQQQCDVLALVQQRLPELETEIAGWREAQASLRQVLRVRQAAAEPPEARDHGSRSLPAAQLHRLSSVIHAEAKTLRALEPFVAQAARALAALPSRWPVRAAVSSEFGRRLSPWSRETEFHDGVDIVARPGTRVVAPSS